MRAAAGIAVAAPAPIALMSLRFDIAVPRRSRVADGGKGRVNPETGPFSGNRAGAARGGSRAA